MSRKDYRAIAESIRLHTEHADASALHVLLLVARDIADTMAWDNPRFDRTRFLAACGVSNA